MTHRFSGNQFDHAMKSNYGPGPTDAGTTTVNAPAMPSINMVPYPTSANSQWRDGTVVRQYANPDQINVGQGTNHKGNQ